MEKSYLAPSTSPLLLCQYVLLHANSEIQLMIYLMYTYSNRYLVLNCVVKFKQFTNSIYVKFVFCESTHYLHNAINHYSSV